MYFWQPRWLKARLPWFSFVFLSLDFRFFYFEAPQRQQARFSPPPCGAGGGNGIRGCQSALRSVCHPVSKPPPKMFKTRGFLTLFRSSASSSVRRRLVRACRWVPRRGANMFKIHSFLAILQPSALKPHVFSGGGFAPEPCGLW